MQLAFESAAATQRPQHGQQMGLGVAASSIGDLHPALGCVSEVLTVPRPRASPQSALEPAAATPVRSGSMDLNQDACREFARVLRQRGFQGQDLQNQVELHAARSLGMTSQQIPADVRALWQPAQPSGGAAAILAARGQAAPAAAAANTFMAMLAAQQQQAQLLAAQQAASRQQLLAAQQAQLQQLAQGRTALTAPAAPQPVVMSAAQIVALRQQQLQQVEQQRAAAAAAKASKKQKGQSGAAYPAPLPAAAAAAAAAVGADQEVELEAEAEDGQAAVGVCLWSEAGWYLHLGGCAELQRHSGTRRRSAWQIATLDLQIATLEGPACMPTRPPPAPPPLPLPGHRRE